MFTGERDTNRIGSMILVTGGTGFLGKSVVSALSQRGRDHRIYSGRVEDSQTLKRELEGATEVIHLASAESRNKIGLLQRVDVRGTENLLQACKSAGVDRLIMPSHLNANANSHYALLRAKGQAERLTRESGVPFTIIRSATLFGREDQFLNVIAGLAAWSWPLVWVPSKGRVAMQPLWVEDLTRCIVDSLDRSDLSGQIVEVAGAERLRYEEIVKHVLLTVGIKRVTFSPGIKLVRPVALVLFGWWRHPPFTRFAMDRFSIPEVAPLDSVRRQFHFEPSRLSQRISYLRRSRPGLFMLRRH